MTAEIDWFSPDPEESVVWTGQPRVWRIWGSVARGVVVSLVVLVVAYVVTTQVSIAPTSSLPLPVDVVVWGVAVLVVLSQVVSIAGAYARTVNTHYVLTDKRVYRKEGVLSEHVSNVGVDRVQETTLSKDVTGNMFDYGTVAISTAGSGGTDLALTDLDDPETFRDRLQEQVRTASPDEDDTGAGLDADAVDALLTEARGLRTVAERLEESV
jgi:uncharacterized membrane protein YdbT with pleckstrin-like domain